MQRAPSRSSKGRRTRERVRAFRERFRLGRLKDVPPFRTSQAALSWRIARLDELRVLTRLLDQYPPRGRVFRIYEAWRELVLLKERRSGKTPPLLARVKEAQALNPPPPKNVE